MVYRLIIWTLFFLALVVDIHFKGGGVKQSLAVTNIIYFLTSLAAVLSTVYILEKVSSKKIAAVTSFIYGVLFYYFKRVASPFSYNIIFNHSDYLTHKAGLLQIFDLTHATFFASDFFNSLAFAVLIYLSYFIKVPKAFEEKPTRNGLISCTVIIFSVSCIQPYSHEPITNFIRSIHRYYFPKNNVIQKKSFEIALLKNQNTESSFISLSKPHIFLIIVESFNGRFINAKNQGGTEYTPFLNEFTKKNISLSNYHSNSIYTAKGQFSALCGQVPLLKETEFKNDSCFEKKCLPTIVSENGYKTLFFQADPNVNTDNTQNFMLKHGFEKMPGLVKPCSEETSPCYGLGIRDDRFYSRVFDYLQKEKTDQLTTPAFITIATVASHMPFKYQPDSERVIFKNPKNPKEHYLNTLRMIDDSLNYFFQRF